MDIVDLAQDHMLAYQAAMIAAAREGGHHVVLGEGEAPRKCVDCDGLIPVKRRRAMPGTCRCADCQTDHEHDGVPE